MLLTWRSTVRSLRTSSVAIALLVRPAATRRSTSSSRAVSPWTSRAAAGSPRASISANAGAAPSPVKAVPRSGELHRRGVLVAEGAAAPGHQRARPGGLVRRVQLLPALRRAPERHQRPLGVALGEQQRSARLRRDRIEHPTLVVGGDPPELVAGGASLVHLSRREHDLDGCRKEAGAGRSLGGLRENAADRGRRGACLPLGEPQQREAGLRLAAALARLSVRVLGRREVTAEPVYLALRGSWPRRRPAGCSPGGSARPPAGPPRAPRPTRLAGP